MVRTTAPSNAEISIGLCRSSAHPQRGSIARRTDGWSPMCHAPRIASAANHTSITGPNTPPIFLVPLC
jgi:hypothetical protein